MNQRVARRRRAARRGVDRLEPRRDVAADVASSDVPDPWRLAVDDRDARLARVHESLLTLADGRLGTRGTPLGGGGGTTPAVFMLGVYTGTGAASRLTPLPPWCTVAVHHSTGAGPRRQTLDLRAGVLIDECGGEAPARALRFSSLARPGTVVLRATGPGLTGDAAAAGGVDDHADAASPVTTTGAGQVVMAVRERRRGTVIDRVACYAETEDVARAAVADAARAGFDRLLREHRHAWSRRWRDADVVIDGDPLLQQSIRFALFHVMASVGSQGEAAVGARGLSGDAYLGHVFWDADVFVLPFLAATQPAAARAMLEYRIRRLPQARAQARRLGRRGARFPWESAAGGEDVTPARVRLATGEESPIRTGVLEEHIVADVAWAAACYVDWTGDAAFAAGPGGVLLAETARYWASRIRRDADGRAHIDEVMGPDEYHHPVDDNAFTNLMARWNLRRAASSAPGWTMPAPPDEVAQWLATADALVDSYDARTGRYEQFAGYFQLEPLIIADLAPRRPIAAELLLGAPRTARSQVIKQADVLMLHHLVPDEVVPGSLPANLAYYEPRTAHGSSLSPAVHASLLARAGRVDDAARWLRIAARMDLDDLSATTAGGLHLATMGGVWQALAFGFAGLQVRGDRLVVRPCLPAHWQRLELNLRFRGARIRLSIEPDRALVLSATARLRRVDNYWEVIPR